MAKKYFVKDASDRDFRDQDIDLVLEAKEKKEVSQELFKELKKKFPYLVFIEE